MVRVTHSLFSLLMVLLVIGVTRRVDGECTHLETGLNKLEEHTEKLGTIVAQLPSIQDSAVELCRDLNVAEINEGTKCRTSKKVIFQLVKRTSTGKEIWKDLKTGILWSDRLDNSYSASEALDICKKNDPDSARARGGLATPDIPTKADYEKLWANGGREVMHGLDRVYWTSSRGTVQSPGQYAYDGTTNLFDQRSANNELSVRCVSR